MVERSKYVLSPWFIGALTLLICNDLWWKTSYSNALTGKLSDLSGVLVLGLLFNLISDRNRKLNALFVVVFFTFWKSPLSEGLIVAWNSLPIFNVERVVDYSDLIAFIGLPVITHFRFKPLEKPSPWAFGTLLGISFFALTSTSRARSIVGGWEYQQEFLHFEVRMSEQQLLENLKNDFHLTPYKVDTIYLSREAAARYHLAVSEERNENFIDSCTLCIRQKNKKSVSIDIQTVHFVQNIQLGNLSELAAMKNKYKARRLKFIWHD